MDESVGGQHEPPPENETPSILLGVYSSGIIFIQSYGWFLLLGGILLLFLKSKLQPYLNQYKKKRDEDDEYRKYDPGVAARRQESMDAARQRLQEKHDAEARRYAEKQKEREEQKRKEKLEDWNRHQQGQGYRSKTRFATNGSHSKDSVKKNKKPTSLRRNDYNPLDSSTGGGSGFRPSRQSGGGGG